MTRGGKRLGAGRPPALEPSVGCNFRLRQSTLEAFHRLVPREARSGWVDQAILQRLKREIRVGRKP